MSERGKRRVERGEEASRGRLCTTRASNNQQNVPPSGRACTLQVVRMWKNLGGGEL